MNGTKGGGVSGSGGRIGYARMLLLLPRIWSGFAK